MYSPNQYNKNTSQGDNKSISLSDNKSISLSIENNITSIYSQYINPSLGQECIKDFAYNGEAEDWGTPNAELWGDHLQNDLLNVIPQNTDMNDKDKS